MYLKRRKASTDPRLRSLLQKAVRRGDADIVVFTIRRLFALGDKTWLRSRAAVITFEECWPLADRLMLAPGEASKIQILKDVAYSEKQKDAAGLGAMAYAYHEGDTSMQEYVDDARSVRLVSEALSRPQQFFDWALNQAEGERATRIVRNAQKYLAAATWGWDKTCILAGAFLATREGIPLVRYCKSTAAQRFPFWAALDKHTPQGKQALRKVCAYIGASYRQVIWASFYCESAATNALSPSPWWEMEKTWRLNKAGLSAGSAAELWASVRPMLERELASEAKDLQAQIASAISNQAELLS